MPVMAAATSGTSSSLSDSTTSTRFRRWCVAAAATGLPSLPPLPRAVAPVVLRAPEPPDLPPGLAAGLPIAAPPMRKLPPLGRLAGTARGFGAAAHLAIQKHISW